MGFLGGGVYESFLSIPEVEDYFSSSNSLFDHGACEDFFLTNAFAYPNLLSFFLMVTSLK